MIEYENPANFVLDSVRFSYKGQIFRGNGFMEWHPSEGFKINALLDKNFAPVDSFGTVGQTILNDRDDAFSIRLSIRGIGTAIVPNVFPLAQIRSLIPDNHLSITASRVVFFINWPKELARSPDSWDGQAVYVMKKPFEFPDSLNQETILGGRVIEKRGSTGLSHDEDGEGIFGRPLDKNQFKLDWSFPANRWTKTSAWKFGEAARRASSIVFAQTVWIRNAKVFRGQLEIHDWRKKCLGEAIDYNFRPFVGVGQPVELYTFNKDAFLKLARFFTQNGSRADVCWKIFHQMAEAASKNTWQARELLLATILEAALRTIDNHPFRPDDRSWDRRRSMERFRLTYLTPEWDVACQKALDTHVRLRHRNAHPDWLTIPDGAMSKAQLKESTKDLVFLSRFYGYMILALAGFKDIKPLFPIVRFSDELQQGNPAQPGN